VSQSSPSRQQ
jgi:hypothetical protein